MCRAAYELYRTRDRKRRGDDLAATAGIGMLRSVAALLLTPVVAGREAAVSTTAPAFDGVLRDAADGSTEAYMIPPYASNHASTLEVLPDGTLAAAWFSGVAEEAPGCAIVVATLPPGAAGWSAATTVSKDANFSNQNPVLFYDDMGHALHLFHSHAPAESGESESVIMHLLSVDAGKTWTAPAVWLAAPGAFPRNRILPAPNGGVLFPFYNASGASKEFGGENYAIMGISDASRNWDPSTWQFLPIEGSGDLVQPSTVQVSANNSLITFFRDRRAQNVYRALVRSACVQTSMLCVCVSGASVHVRCANASGVTAASIHAWPQADPTGHNWTTPDTSANLPNNNAGIEANVVKPSDRIVLAFNPQTSARDPLAVALSDDGGVSWPHQRYLQHGVSGGGSSSSGSGGGGGVDAGTSTSASGNEFSYPSTLVTYHPNGSATLHVTYTYLRDTIKYKRFDEAWCAAAC